MNAKTLKAIQERIAYLKSEIANYVTCQTTHQVCGMITCTKREIAFLKSLLPKRKTKGAK